MVFHRGRYVIPYTQRICIQEWMRCQNRVQDAARNHMGSLGSTPGESRGSGPLDVPLSLVGVLLAFGTWQSRTREDGRGIRPGIKPYTIRWRVLGQYGSEPSHRDRMSRPGAAPALQNKACTLGVRLL